MSIDLTAWHPQYSGDIDDCGFPDCDLVHWTPCEQPERTIDEATSFHPQCPPCLVAAEALYERTGELGDLVLMTNLRFWANKAEEEE